MYVQVNIGVFEFLEIVQGSSHDDDVIWHVIIILGVHGDGQLTDGGKQDSMSKVKSQYYGGQKCLFKEENELLSREHHKLC